MRGSCLSKPFSTLMKRYSSFPARIVVIVLGASLIFSQGACKPTPTITPTTPPTKTYTPNPTPTETPKPTETPLPTPTPAPPFEAKGLDNLRQVDSAIFTGTTKMDVTSGYNAGKSQSESRIVYVREPTFYHFYGKTSPYHVSPDDGNVSDLGIQDGDDLIVELYTDGEQQVFSMGSVHQYSNMTNVAALGMGDDFDIAASMDLAYEGWDRFEGYGFLQWLGPLEFDGLKRLNEIPCLNYVFDEDDIDDDALPNGMNVTEASGSVCIAQPGNYLVHMDLKMTGENLYLGPPDPELVAEGEDTPLVEAGSLHHVKDVSQVNQLTAMKEPTEMFDNVRPPWDIPIFKNASPVIAITGIHNYSHYSFVTNDEPLVVINFYKNDMPALKWNFSAQRSVEGGVELTFKKDDRVYTIWAGTVSDQTIFIIETKSSPGRG